MTENVSSYTRTTEHRQVRIRASASLADRDRLHKAITEELSRHSEKHGESPRYAPDDYEAEREPMHWEPYVICNADGTDYPCRTRRILGAALDKEGNDDD